MWSTTETPGYAHVSTAEQKLDVQLDALTAAGCTRLFPESASGKRLDHLEFERLLDYARRGDTTAVYRLDRLSRSVSDLVATMTHLCERGIEFRSLSEQIDTTTPGGL